MAAVPNQPQENSFQVKNTFAEAIDVKVRLSGPEGWRIEPKEFSLHLKAGAESKNVFRVTLPLDAPSGRQMLGIDFDIQADRGYCYRGAADRGGRRRSGACGHRGAQRPRRVGSAADDGQSGQDRPVSVAG